MPVLAGGFFVLVGAANATAAADPASFDSLLAFEGSPVAALPPSWRGGAPETLFADDKIFHGGAQSGRIERTAISPRP